MKNRFMVTTICLVLVLALLSPAACSESGGGSFSVSLETKSTLPLTPLKISLRGLPAEESMTVTFSNSSGYSVTKKVLRVTQDVTILVGVPLYVNPKTHQITKGKVNVVVSQHLSDGSQGQQSKPVSFTIEDLPSLEGMPLGKVTRSFFTASALLSQRYITALQFCENASDGKIDTSSARSQETDILKSILNGRNDIDSIINDPTHVINVGSAADGTPLQFTRDSLEIMDRTIAIWLSGLLSGEQSAPTASAEPVSSRLLGAGAAFSESAKPLSLSIVEDSVDLDMADADSNNYDWLNNFSDSICTYHGLNQAMETLANKLSDMIDRTTASLDALSNIGDLTEYSPPVVVGLSASLPTTGNAVRHIVDNIMGGAGEAAVSSASPYNTEGPDMDAITESTASQYLSTLLSAGITNLELIYGGQSFGLAKLGLLIFNAIASGKDAQVNEAIVENNDLIRSGGGMINGLVQESRTQSGLDMIVVSTTPFEGAPVAMTALTDADGYYELLVPTDPDGNLPSSLTFKTSDPLTDFPYGTEVVDLRGIDTNKPVSVPTMSIAKPETPSDTSPTTTITEPPASVTYSGSLTITTTNTEIFMDVCNVVTKSTVTIPFDKLTLKRGEEGDISYGCIQTLCTYTVDWAAVITAQPSDSYSYSVSPSSGKHSQSRGVMVYGVYENGQVSFGFFLLQDLESSLEKFTLTEIDSSFDPPFVIELDFYPVSYSDEVLSMLALGATGQMSSDLAAFCSIISKNSQIKSATPEKSQDIKFSGSLGSPGDIQYITYEGNLALKFEGR